MSTRASDQQKKQRQKEFLERKKHQESLKISAREAKHNSPKNDNNTDRGPKIED
ncbi:hypothetical protein [Pontibacter beigongshangensis]|uniref:hypothetical protein n=1 Tax=Pontibacter beigongshangensis TaxID=2574733 RepID=UPI0016504952|nr:hypothetical protein [Pontibacter beigongshangensis]